MLLVIFEFTIGTNILYIESLGILSAIVEATLGIPQFCKNLRNKSTEGLSYYTYSP